MYIANLNDDVHFEALSKRGAEKVKVKHLIHKGAGADKFTLRYFSVAQGGHTPRDQHLGEHEVFVVRGRAQLKGIDWERTVGPGDAVFIASNEVHQFLNTGNEPFEFLSVRGADELYTARETAR